MSSIRQIHRIGVHHRAAHRTQEHIHRFGRKLTPSESVDAADEEFALHALAATLGPTTCIDGGLHGTQTQIRVRRADVRIAALCGHGAKLELQANGLAILHVIHE